MGLSNAPCPDGSEIEGALQPQAVEVYRAVCAAFPELTTYGGQDGHGEHVNGEAIDFMVPDSGTGQRLTRLPLRAPRRARPVRHHLEPARSGPSSARVRASVGWRTVGRATANHFDHVHIKIN